MAGCSKINLQLWESKPAAYTGFVGQNMSKAFSKLLLLVICSYLGKNTQCGERNQKQKLGPIEFELLGEGEKAKNISEELSP